MQTSSTRLKNQKAKQMDELCPTTNKEPFITSRAAMEAGVAGKVQN